MLWQTFASAAASWMERDGGKGPIELVGRGDMVLEVVSDSSDHKDRVELRRDYAAAGFPENWIVDARRDPLEFRILRLEAGIYRDTLGDDDGWMRSNVWGRCFKLDLAPDRLGQPRYRLHVR